MKTNKPALLMFISLFYFYGFFSSFAQDYVYEQKTGQDPYMYYFRGSAQHIYQAPKENQLSTWQQLPFGWNFFGTSVRGFYISDNGYITFDSAATASKLANTALPDTAAPKNSIFAYWTDLHLEAGNPQWTNEVCVSNTGTAPKRVMIIYWLRVVPSGMTYSSGNIGFAIALYEGGGFDIVYSVLSGTITCGGTTGAINNDGSKFIMVSGSPSINFPTVAVGDADDICYLFRTPFAIDPHSTNSISQADLSIFPNPLTEKSQIRLSLPEADYIRFYITDLSGRMIEDIYDGNMAKGAYCFEFNVVCLPIKPQPGILFLHLKGNKTSCVRKIIWTE
jgi:hypothetical protein